MIIATSVKSKTPLLAPNLLKDLAPKLTLGMPPTWASAPRPLRAPLLLPPRALCCSAPAEQ